MTRFDRPRIDRARPARPLGVRLLPVVCCLVLFTAGCGSLSSQPLARQTTTTEAPTTTTTAAPTTTTEATTTTTEATTTTVDLAEADGDGDGVRDQLPETGPNQILLATVFGLTLLLGGRLVLDGESMLRRRIARRRSVMPPR